MTQQAIQNGTGVNTPQISLDAQAQQAKRKTLQKAIQRRLRKERRETRREWWLAYRGAFIAISVFIQFIASVATVALYFAPKIPIPFIQDTVWYAPVTGAFISYVFFWLFGAWAFRNVATIEGGNSRSYGLLRTRYHQLIARLGPEEYNPFPKQEAIRIKLAKLENPQPYQLIALREAYRCMESVRDMLQKHRTGSIWSQGLGYITIWGMLHRAEEALIEIEPLPLVIRGAMHDKWSIEHAQIGNREELLQTIIQAVADVDKNASLYFKEHQPDASAIEVEQLHKKLAHTKEIITQLRKAVTNTNNPVFIVDDDDMMASNTSTPDVSTTNAQAEAKREAEARGRFALHEVRRTLNQYRDNLWEGLVRSRNQLWNTAALTALITHILVCTAIIVGDNSGNIRDNIIAGTMFYITGAIAGLFIRFYRESTNNSAVDDYGLSTIRLIVTPLLSGLAAIGGVLIVSLLYGASLDASSATIQSIPSLSKIFLLDNPLRLIVAAVFGVAPNLIIRSLQNQTEKYATDLQKSSTITGTASDDTTS